MPNYFKNHEVEIIELYIFGFVFFFFFKTRRGERDTILIDGGILLQDEDDNKN